MKLTGKCKEDFENWYRKQTPEMGYWYSILNFNNLPFSMKYGVYVDFFDSVGLIVEAQRCLNGYKYYVTSTPKYFQAFEYKTRQEAREKAIEKANEIYNNDKEG